MMSYKTTGLAVLTALLSVAALAADLTQTATLKDLQTVGTTSKKQKHQQYDFILDTPSNEYVCRTKLGSSMKPTQFVVGSTLEFKVSGQKGQVTNSAGNHVGCGIVKVVAPPASTASPTPQ
jgi:opacity protein-like surface antigen